MIPARLLVRAATVLALTRGGAAPFPTMAGECVFDSKLMPIIDVAQEGQTPVILVYTDEDMRENLDRNSSRPNWKRTLTLLIEMSIGTVRPGQNGGRASFAYAETDSELEALLDIMEAEVEVALAAVDNPFAMFWKKLIRQQEEWASVPFRSSEQTARYAIRQVALKVEINPDCMPVAVKAGDPRRIATGDLLPIPYLAALSQQISGNPDVFASTIALLSGASQQTVFPILKRVGITTVEPSGEVRAEVNLEEPS